MVFDNHDGFRSMLPYSSKEAPCTVAKPCLEVRAESLNRTIPLLGLQSSRARPASRAHSLDSSARHFAAHPFLEELDAVFRCRDYLVFF